MDASEFAARLARLGIRPEAVEERFARASGPGGQHVNKVSTAVSLRHAESGVAVTAHDSRSQAANREVARERLIAALEARREAARAERQQEREKRRRQNRPRPRGVQRRMVDSKKKRGALKKMRGRVEGG